MPNWRRIGAFVAANARISQRRRAVGTQRRSAILSKENAMTGSTPPKTLIECRGVTVTGGSTPILKSIDLAIHENEIVSLIGPNGSGKSTLVRTLLGVVGPSAGQVLRAPGLTIGYIPQRIKFDQTLPLRVDRFLTLGTGTAAPGIRPVLDELKCGHIAKRQMTDLSGGELQRVMLARALLRAPALLVLDEPAQGLDVTGQVEFYRLLQDIRKRFRCGILIVSHDLHLVLAATDHVICLNHHICCVGKPDRVAGDPEFIKLFGPETAAILAPYSHDHDHEHGVSGEISAAHEHPRG